jgi:hypothetical protein
MWVEVCCVGLKGLYCPVVPPPKVILGSSNKVSSGTEHSPGHTNPEDIPPRRSLSPRHSPQPIVRRLQSLLAPQHQLSNPDILFMSDRTLRQASRIPRHIIDIGEEPIRQHIRLGSSFLQVMLSVVLHDSLDMGQAFGNQPLVHSQEPCQRDSEVPVVIQTDHITADLDTLGIYESHPEATAKLEALPDKVAARYYPEHTFLEGNGRGRCVTPTSAAPRRSRLSLL